jgi:TRAP-type mannitol/chloroaromatic compound transport system permease large subunit
VQAATARTSTLAIGPHTQAEPPLSRAQTGAVLSCLLGLGALLVGVASGHFYAVEAAATGCVTLAEAAALMGQLPLVRLRLVLDDALVLSGSLFALFVAATSFTLVLRLLGTDHLVEQVLSSLPGGAMGRLAGALAMIGACSLVLDAFEMIFVVIPIVLPIVLTQVADAQWVGVLTLLVLQLSFMLPPLGYAVMLSAARLAGNDAGSTAGGTAQPAVAPIKIASLIISLAPYVASSVALLLTVALAPALVHSFDAPLAAKAATLSNDEVTRSMQAAPSSREGSKAEDADSMRGFDLPAGTPAPH